MPVVHPPAPRAVAPPTRPPVPRAEGFEVARLSLDPALELTAWVAPDLGNSSYVLSLPEERSAVVVDPLRDIDGYLPYLRQLRTERVLALETHIHNDFVSGSRALAQEARAEIGASADAPLDFPHRSLHDGDVLPLGRWGLEVLATPGHTPEHVSYLLRDAGDKPRALFSGGVLTIGGAARTDLLGLSKARPLAHDLYRSLQEKVAPLPGSVELLPTHGGGSFCSAVIGGERTGTLREERGSNPLLRSRSEEEFVGRILEQGPFPSYFLRMRALNSAGKEPVAEAPPRPRALPLDRFDRWRTEGATVLDTRAPELFDGGHIPGSMAVAEDGPLSAWVGWLLPPERDLLFLSADEEEAARSARQLYRIGYDRVQGFLAGGFRSWEDAGRPVVQRASVEMEKLRRQLRSNAPAVVLDVREAHEWFEGHIPGSLNIPVSAIPARMGEVPRGVPLYVHCARGYRASIAASLLEQGGFDAVVRVSGGYEEWSRPPSRAGGRAPSR